MAQLTKEEAELIFPGALVFVHPRRHSSFEHLSDESWGMGDPAEGVCDCSTASYSNRSREVGLKLNADSEVQ